MKVAALLIGFGLLTAMSTAASAQGVADLAWMSGDWAEEKDGRWTEESWSRPRGGVMLGTGRSGRGERVADWEFLRIEADSSGVPSYWGSPRGAPPVAFRLVSISRTEAVFENPKHDYPARIVYRREGQALVATISAANGARPTSWRYRRR
jgi:hypothetical protein